MELKGKRLLILGASGLLCNAVETAKNMGIYTIVTDYNPGAPAKKMADKSFDVSTTDIDALERIAHENNVDGVFTGFSDVNLHSARELCDRLHLPFYATKEQIGITTHKLKFKELCRKHQVPTVKQFELDSNWREDHLQKIEYPVMVKPADSYASKGCSVCATEEELRRAVEKALPFSESKQVIVEKYMDSAHCDDVGISYLFVDGKAYLIYVGDRHTNHEQQEYAPLTAAVIAPSKYVEEYIRDVDQYAKEMFAAIGIRNGRVSIQAFHDEQGFCFYEMGFRLTGGRQYLVTREEFDVDDVVALIQFALTGKIQLGDLNRCEPRYNSYFCDLVVICSQGTISRIEGLEQARKDPRVLDVAQLLNVGSVVVANGTQNQVLARICIKEESEKALMEAISEIGKKIVAYDENGAPMMLKIFGC